MASYNPDDLIGKTFFPIKRVFAYKDASTIDKPIFFFDPSVGNPIGVVFSYVQKPTGLWWQFKRNTKSYFVKHEEGAFNLKDLKNQGLQTEAEKAEAEAEKNKSYLEKIFDFGKKGGTAIIIVLLGIYAYKNLKK
jgi:hypothetical protein